MTEEKNDPDVRISDGRRNSPTKSSHLPIESEVFKAAYWVSSLGAGRGKSTVPWPRCDPRNEQIEFGPRPYSRTPVMSDEGEWKLVPPTFAGADARARDNNVGRAAARNARRRQRKELEQATSKAEAARVQKILAGAKSSVLCSCVRVPPQWPMQVDRVCLGPQVRRFPMKSYALGSRGLSASRWRLTRVAIQKKPRSRAGFGVSRPPAKD